MHRHCRAAQFENHLLAAARRRRFGGAAGAGGRWLHRRRTVRSARRAERRFSECARPRLESGKSRGLRHHHRARQTDRRRLDLGQRSGLRSPWRRCTFHAGCRRSLENVHRQSNRRPAGRLRALGSQKGRHALRRKHYVVKTLVTTEMVRRIADHYGVETHGDLQVGFKWIGKEIDDAGPDRFVFGCEESHGYLVGTHVRDKDAAVAAMLLAELAARCKADGKTLHEQLDSLYWQFGYHAESQFSLTMPGAAGMHDMQKLMARLRSDPPAETGRPQSRANARLQIANRTRCRRRGQAVPGPSATW